MNQAINRPLDIGCVADLCVDLMVTGDVIPRFHQIEQLVDDYALEPGGSATIFASQFAKLGGRVGLIGAVGADAFGEYLTTALQAAGVDMRRVQRRKAIKTGLGLHLVKDDGDRATLTYLGSIDAPRLSDLTDDLLFECRHWHLASPFLLTNLRGHWKGWLERCRAAGMTTSMDTNWDPEDRWEGIQELLPLIDVFLPNEAEARAISGEEDVFRAGERLASSGPLVVIKRGSEGSTAFWTAEGGLRIVDGNSAIRDSQSALPVVDAVGAGDNFDAGFLRAWLLGQEVESCLHLATRCAVASLGAPGGIRGQLREGAME